MNVNSGSLDNLNDNVAAKSGRRWVLLRGLVREQRHWQDFPEKLQQYFPDDEIVMHDFSGNGKRYREKSATSISGMVDDVRYALSTEAIETPVTIIALSLGGMVAAEWMSQYPDECAGAVLISTSMKGLNPIHQRLLPAVYPTIIRSLLIPESRETKEGRILKLVSNIAVRDSVRREELISDWVAYAREYPVSSMNGLRQLLAAARFQAPEQAPEMPVLVLRSLADHMVSPECSATLAKHWRATLETHQISGHDIPLDDADWVCRKISAWSGE